MKIWMGRTLAGVLGVVALAALGFGAGVYLGQRKLQRVVTVQTHPVALRDDAASIERGRYLFASRGCSECHGADGAGRTVVDDPSSGLLAISPNISPGTGSVVATYQPADWDRILRHGLKPGGRPALVMPSEDYARLTDDDLAALVAYVRQLAPAAGRAAQIRMPALLSALYGFGRIQDAAEKIDHTLPPAQPVPEGVSVAHGRYVGQMCQGCHGPQMSGGKIPGGPPDWPAAANLTPGAGSAMVRYADANAFRSMLRSGKRPDGSAVNGAMPFGTLRALNDVDVEALYLYLRSLPARDAGGR